jgi:hypothetical protein
MTPVCPSVEYHGNPFRYCPECHWVEPSKLPDDVRTRFEFHPATEDTRPLHESLRTSFVGLAAIVAELVPVGRHQSLAYTALQEALFWANAGVEVEAQLAEYVARAIVGAAVNAMDNVEPVVVR